MPRFPASGPHSTAASSLDFSARPSVGTESQRSQIVSQGLRWAAHPLVVTCPKTMTAAENSPKPTRLEPDVLARRIVDIASDKQANDIVLLDLRPLTVIADYFVICSGGSERQLQAIQRDIAETLRNEDKIRPTHVEGSADSGWVLMDYSDVVVHIFSPSQRAYYDLEELWSAAHPVVRIQ